MNYLDDDDHDPCESCIAAMTYGHAFSSVANEPCTCQRASRDHDGGCDHTDTYMVDGGRICGACRKVWAGGCAP